MTPDSDAQRLRELVASEMSAADEEGEQSAGLYVDLPAVDLRTLLSEMAALKAEVRAETQSARDLRKGLERSLETLQTELTRSQQRNAELRAELEQAESKHSRRSALALMDVADRVEAAVSAARMPEPSRPGRWWWQRPRVIETSAIDALVEGLVLTLRRVQSHLGDLGVRRIETQDRPFDPTHMEAVGAISRAGVDEGRVVEEITAGYSASDGVVRSAQVVVNRKGSDRE